MDDGTLKVENHQLTLAGLSFAAKVLSKCYLLLTSPPLVLTVCVSLSVCLCLCVSVCVRARAFCISLVNSISFLNDHEPDLVSHAVDMQIACPIVASISTMSLEFFLSAFVLSQVFL